MKSKEEYIHLLLMYKTQMIKRFGIRSIRIFGSVARGEQHEGSDVDICVETETPNPFLLLDLKEELERLLECSVDIVRFREKMNPSLRQQIESEGVYV